MHQELDNVKMATVCRQPEWSVPFLVSYVDMGTPGKTGGSHKKAVQLKGRQDKTYTLTTVDIQLLTCPWLPAWSVMTFMMIAREDQTIVTFV